MGPEQIQTPRPAYLHDIVACSRWPYVRVALRPVMPYVPQSHRYIGTVDGCPGITERERNGIHSYIAAIKIHDRRIHLGESRDLEKTKRWRERAVALKDEMGESTRAEEFKERWVKLRLEEEET